MFDLMDVKRVSTTSLNYKMLQIVIKAVGEQLDKINFPSEPCASHLRREEFIARQGL